MEALRSDTIARVERMLDDALTEERASREYKYENKLTFQDFVLFFNA